MLAFLLLPRAELPSATLPDGTRVRVAFSKDSYYGNLKVVDYSYGETRTRELIIDGLVQGGVDLATIQKHLNFFFGVARSLRQREVLEPADYFASGLKGREREERYEDHLALEGVYPMELLVDGKLVTEQVPLRNAMTEILRDSYVEDCDRGVQRWNKILDKYGITERLSLRTVASTATSAPTPGPSSILRAGWSPRMIIHRGYQTCNALPELIASAQHSACQYPAMQQAAIYRSRQKSWHRIA